MGLSFLQEIQESFTAATEADDPHGRANVKRLKAGMEWFVKVWADEDRAWTPALATQWGNALATWLELEEITRRLYGWQGCPMKPGRCNPYGPFVCEACADRTQEKTGESPPGGCEGGESQAPLFRMPGGHYWEAWDPSMGSLETPWSF